MDTKARPKTVMPWKEIALFAIGVIVGVVIA